MGQLCDGSHGSWVTKDDPFPSLVVIWRFKLQKFIGVFKGLGTYFHKSALELYFAFVYPHLLNGIEIYANTGSTHLDKLQELNNKTLRVVQN